MNNKKSAILPVLFSFIIMGIGDVSGIVTSHVKEDFGLSETLAGTVPMAIFVWFLLLSAPTALIMNRIGRKNAVLASNALTMVGLLLPLFSYNIVSCLVACAFLGIGNTIIQVALNPLVSDVVGDSRSLSGCISAGQVLKALSACCAPYLALACASALGSWKYMFPAFAIVTVVISVWLLLTGIEESEACGGSSLSATLGLLGDKFILCCFFAIFTVVGLDVGCNVITPKLLMERCSIDLNHAQLGITVYFVCKTAGSFAGAMILGRVSDLRFFRCAISIVALAIAGLFFVQDKLMILALIGSAGFFSATIFSVIISLGISYLPSKSNEISGLMVMGIIGGGVVTLLMGLTADTLGSQIGSLSVIAACVLYLALCAYLLLNRK